MTGGMLREGTGRLLVGLSGAQPEVLDQCPGESYKFQVLGLSVLFEGFAAAGSAWLAVRAIERASVLLAMTAGLAWGLAIIVLDRRIVRSLPAGRPRLRMTVVPVFGLAILLAALTSLPFLIQIVQPEIDSQAALIRTQRLTAFLAAEKKGQAGQLVTAWGKDVSDLEIIQSLGGKPFDPAADPELRTLAKERATAITAGQGYFEQWQCQLYGGQGCPVRGSGPAAQASRTSYLTARQQAAKLTTEIKTRYRQLSRAHPSSGKAAHINVAPQLSEARVQLRSAELREIRQEDTFRAHNGDGIKVMLEALAQVSASNPRLGIACLLALALLTIILCLPVLVRLSQPTGDHEVLLRSAISPTAGTTARIGALTMKFWPRNGAADKRFHAVTPAPDEIAGHAFISYVREDKDNVDRLQQVLEAASIPVWRDIRDLQPGQDWKLTIRHAISDDALAFVACFSRASIGKRKSYQNDELRLAIDQFRQMPPGQLWLIPVRFDHCGIPDFDLGGGRTLAAIQHADLFGDTRADHTARLVRTILQILGRAPVTDNEATPDSGVAGTFRPDAADPAPTGPHAALEDATPAPFPDNLAAAAQQDSYLSQLTQDAEANPSFIITAAWEQLNGTVADLVGAARVPSRNQPAALRALEGRGIVTPDLASQIRELRERRNRVAHGRHNPTRDEAIAYARSAEALIGHVDLEIRQLILSRADINNEIP